MATLERAISIAVQAHRGQGDKSGAPYILHPLRVMRKMPADTEMIVAVLHDVIEDSNWTLEGLRKEGFSEEVLSAIDCLTERDAEAYDDYIERVASDPISRHVKLVDIEDNMDTRRLGQLTDKDIARMEKYRAAWLRLSGPGIFGRI